MSRIHSSSKTGRKRGNALFFTLVLLMSTMLAMVAVPEASADNSTSTATALSTGTNYEYVCNNDHIAMVQIMAAVLTNDYWKATFYTGDEFTVTIYNYCDPDLAKITLRYYTPGIGWDSTQEAKLSKTSFKNC